MENQMSGKGRSPVMDHSEEFRQKAHAIKQDVQDLGRLTKTVAQESFDQFKGQVSESYKHGKEKAHQWEESLENQIRSHPMKSLLIAAGVGLIIGALWKSK